MRKPILVTDGFEKLQEIEIPDTGVKMLGLEVAHPQAPKARPYRFPKAETADVAAGVKLGLNIMLTGPTGCGKTSLPTAIAAKLGRPLVRFNMNGETRVAHILGQQRPVAQEGVLTLVFSLGVFAQAMRDGYWVILDEIEAALPSVLFVLQPVLEEGNRSIQIPDTGEVIHAHPEFAIFATGNTLGYRAAARAKYAGTNVLNSAFVDRFGMVIDCAYPSRQEEVERVRVHVPDCDSDYIDGICRTAEELRRDSGFRADFSTRRCIQWARLLAPYANDVLQTAELAFVRKLESPTDAKVAREVIRRIFGYSQGV